MATTPITLVGHNLGERHRHLNSLVREAQESSLHGIENGAVDRLFKIDVASKERNVDFIINNLKGDDLLYVSRALKATWLLDNKHRNIINPNHLENVLFPEMVTTAIAKMKHWLYINLRDPERCLEFYNYYKSIQFSFAIKFLCRCDNQYILDEFPNILTRVTPHYLKLFSEKCPRLAKIYYDALTTDKEVTAKYLADKDSYLDSIKSVLKADPDVYLDIIETYYNNANSLSAVATKFILTHHKDRYLAKPELYSAWLLHLPTLAKLLTVTECEELTIKLAKAKYLIPWFSYKAVEPLIKRIKPDCRAAFKRRVFVDKDVGEFVYEWPYPKPTSPLPCEKAGSHVFDDVEYTSKEYTPIKNRRKIYNRPKRRPCPKYRYSEISEECQRKSEIDQIFNECRFFGFGRTFYELSKRLYAVSSVETRRNIFMLLISKTGGRLENISVLLQLMARHINEPADFRADIVRSLVKSAQVWRLPTDSWELLLQFSHHLGLDGAETECECHEGIHAVVLREFLLKNDLDPILREVFLTHFSTLREYSLTADEGTLVFEGLKRTLLTKAENAEPWEAFSHLMNLFNIYADYKICFTVNSPIIPVVKELSHDDPNAAKEMLTWIYNSHVARKELFLENLSFLQNDAAYVNILRHDARVISSESVIENVVEHRKPLNQFMRKLSVYFGEKCGLAAEVLKAMKKRVEDSPDVSLARPIATLIGEDLISFMQYLDMEKEEIDKKRMTAALRANAHCARPNLNIDELDMLSVGAKALTTRSIVCRATHVEKYVYKLVAWRRTVRTALVLAQNLTNEGAIIAIAANIRPIAVIKHALGYLKRRGDKSDVSVWDAIKPIILSTDLSEKRRLKESLLCVQSMPVTIRADYCATVYIQLRKISEGTAVHALHQDLEELLPAMKPESVEDILVTMLSRHSEDPSSMLYPNFFIKYMLLCKSDQEQTKRFETIGTRFLKRLEAIREDPEIRNIIPYRRYLDRIIKCLRYNKVFFDAQYVSCLPVIDKIETWLKTFLQIETNFATFAELRLTVLYYEAVGQSIKKAPGMFSDLKNINDTGVTLVAKQFGANVVRGLKEFTTKYFDSITELFKETFPKYFNNYFLGGPSKNRFRSAVMNEILEADTGSATRLVTYYNVYQNCQCRVTDAQELLSRLASKDLESRFFIYAEY